MGLVAWGVRLRVLRRWPYPWWCAKVGYSRVELCCGWEKMMDGVRGPASLRFSRPSRPVSSILKCIPRIVYLICCARRLIRSPRFVVRGLRSRVVCLGKFRFLGCRRYVSAAVRLAEEPRDDCFVKDSDCVHCKRALGINPIQITRVCQMPDLAACCRNRVGGADYRLRLSVVRFAYDTR